MSDNMKVDLSLLTDFTYFNSHKNYSNLEWEDYDSKEEVDKSNDMSEDEVFTYTIEPRHVSPFKDLLKVMILNQPLSLFMIKIVHGVTQNE